MAGKQELSHGVSLCLQVNWQMLWVTRKKRFALRVAGWLVLGITILFPVGLLTGMTFAGSNAEPICVSA
jgi:hypothetical protein